MKPGTITLGAYTIHVGRGLLDRVGTIARGAVKAHRWAIIADSNVAPRYAARVAASFGDAPADLFTVPAGEAHKTREQWARLPTSSSPPASGATARSSRSAAA